MHKCSLRYAGRARIFGMCRHDELLIGDDTQRGDWSERNWRRLEMIGTEARTVFRIHPEPHKGR